MKYSMNKTMMEDPDRPPPQGPMEVWGKVFTKPGEQTFIEITSHPDAKARSAYIWVFIAGTLSGLINSLTNIAVGMTQLQNSAPGLEGASGTIEAIGLFTAICFAPLYGAFSVLAFAIGAAIFQATASFLGGKGSFDKLTYAFGAMIAPVTIFWALLIPFNVIPYVAFCTIPLSLVVSLYVLYLELAAIKAVHQLGWAEATGALLTPMILGFMSIAVIFLLILRLGGLSINQFLEILKQGVP